MQAELEREKDRLKLLLDMTNTLVSNLEPRDLLRAISASIRQDMHCDVVGVWLPDVASSSNCANSLMDFPESKGFATEDLLYPVEGSIVGGVFKTGKPVVIGTRADYMSDRGASAVRVEAIESGCRTAPDQPKPNARRSDTRQPGRELIQPGRR